MPQLYEGVARTSTSANPALIRNRRLELDSVMLESLRAQSGTPNGARFSFQEICCVDFD